MPLSSSRSRRSFADIPGRVSRSPGGTAARERRNYKLRRWEAGIYSFACTSGWKNTSAVEITGAVRTRCPHSPMAASKSGEENRAPKLFPTLLVLGLLLWIIATSGGRHIFISEILGKAYDSQAEHFLRGDVDVDGDAIIHEVLIVNGKSR